MKLHSFRQGNLPQLAGCELRPSRAVDSSGSVLAPRNQLFRVDGYSLWVGGDLTQALPLLAIEPGGLRMQSRRIPLSSALSYVSSIGRRLL